MNQQQVTENGGFYFVAPASDPGDRYAAGIEGNRFATTEDAEEAIAALKATPGFDGEWVVRWHD